MLQRTFKMPQSLSTVFIPIVEIGGILHIDIAYLINEQLLVIEI